MSDARTWALVVYILYLVGLAVGITLAVGLIMAYVGDYRLARLSQTDPRIPVRSHYRFQVRTFWIGALITVIGVFAVILHKGLAFLVLCLATIWFVVRCAKGMIYLLRHEPVPNPTSFFFG